MEDPVFLVVSGHTFDRCHIENWLKRNPTCPVSQKPVDMSSGAHLETNWNLRSMIQDWKEERKAKALRDAHILHMDWLGREPPSPGGDLISVADSRILVGLLKSKDVAAVAAATAAVERLLSMAPTPEKDPEKEYEDGMCIALIGILSPSDPDAYRIKLAKAEPLIRLVVQLLNSRSEAVQLAAAQSILIIAYRDMYEGILTEVVVKAGALNPLLVMLTSGRPVAVRVSFDALDLIIFGSKRLDQNDAIKETLWASLLEPLLRLLDGRSSAELLGNVVRLLDLFYNGDRDDMYVERLVEENGVVRRLIHLKHLPDFAKTLFRACSEFPGLRGRMIDEGVVGKVVQILVDEPKSEWAMTTFFNLVGEEGFSKTLMEEGGLGPLVVSLGAQNENMAIQSAIVITHLAEVAANREAIADSGALPGLVAVLGSDSQSVFAIDGQKSAATALYLLGQSSDVLRAKIAAAGAVPALIRVVVESGKSVAVASAAVRALRTLSLDDANQAKMAEAGALTGLVGLLDDEGARLDVLWVLSNLAMNPACKVKLIEAGVLPVLAELKERSGEQKIVADLLRLRLDLPLAVVKRKRKRTHF